MTNLFFHGIEPELSKEDRAAARQRKADDAREAIGKPPPMSALEEARAMRALAAGPKPDDQVASGSNE